MHYKECIAYGPIICSFCIYHDCKVNLIMNDNASKDRRSASHARILRLFLEVLILLWLITSSCSVYDLNQNNKPIPYEYS